MLRRAAFLCAGPLQKSAVSNLFCQKRSPAWRLNSALSGVKQRRQGVRENVSGKKGKKQHDFFTGPAQRKAARSIPRIASCKEPRTSFRMGRMKREGSAKKATWNRHCVHFRWLLLYFDCQFDCLAILPRPDLFTHEADIRDGEGDQRQRQQAYQMRPYQKQALSQRQVAADGS